jgi:hypothetical protein
MPFDPEAAEKRKYLESLDDAQLGCLGGGHDWPLDHLRPGKAVPKGLRAEPAEIPGCHVIIEMCRERCGTERTVLRNSDGSLDRFSYARRGRRPGEPPIWQIRPEGLHVTRRDARAVVISMSLGALTA